MNQSYLDLMLKELSKEESKLIYSVASDLSQGGGKRSILLIGKDRSANPITNGIAKSLLERNSNYLWIDIDGRTCKSPNSFLSCMARNLRAGSGVNTKDLGLFAREMGKLLTPFSAQTNPDNDQPNGDRNPTVEKAFSLWEQHFKINEKKDTFLTPVFCFSNLNDFSDEMLGWMTAELNSSLRKTKAFKNTRFVFASPSPDKRIADFFNRFGFEKILRYIIPTAKKQTQNPMAVVQAKKEPRTKELKKNMKSDNVSNFNMGKSGIESTKGFSSFSENGQKYLILASLPSLISRSTLEFFCDERESAFCYNWLARQSFLYKTNSDGFLILNDDIKSQARVALKERDAKAEQKEVLASVLDAFMKLFPDPDTHWIPVNLQIFASFTEDLLAQIFDPIDCNQITDFLSDHSDQFTSEDDFYSMKEDAKLVTKRLMELSNLCIIEDLPQKVDKIWQEDQSRISSRKSKVEGKKVSIEQEIEEIKEQITHFDQMRNQIDDEFQNPENYKAKKVYSFSTALPLLVLGLVTIGASLFSESIGTYHAACGLFLTFTGFFWPSISVQKPDLQTVGGKPKLAVETQRRSLNHRISGLVNRASLLKVNLSDLDTELETLDLGSQTPYLA